MATMIECVARALCRNAGDAEDVMVDGAPKWASRTHEARAILAAMREPDEEMTAFGAEVVPGDDPANHREVALDVWRGMIAAALDEH